MRAVRTPRSSGPGGSARTASCALAEGDDVDSLARRLGDVPVDLVIDPVSGIPAAAALRTLRPGGRLVNLGSAAGDECPVSSAVLRSRSLHIHGYTNNELDADRRREALLAVVGYAIAGDLTVDHERVPLARSGYRLDPPGPDRAGALAAVAPGGQHFPISRRPPVLRRDGRQAVDVAVEHAERRCDEDGVVQFDVGRPFGAGRGDELLGDGAAGFPDRERDPQQRLELADTGASSIPPHAASTTARPPSMVSAAAAAWLPVQKRHSLPFETTAAISSRSPTVSVLGPRSRPAPAGSSGAAVSGR